jgi:hypothetical protein
MMIPSFTILLFLRCIGTYVMVMKYFIIGTVHIMSYQRNLLLRFGVESCLNRVQIRIFKLELLTFQ